jgi:hypothetical protein
MIFVDESIQHDLGYICVGFAYCKQSPDELVRSAISQAGLVPGIDEYKSGARMVGAGARRMLREAISQIVLEHCKLGVYIGPTHERPALLSAVADTARSIVSRNRLPAPQPVYVDGGIDSKLPSVADDSINLIRNCDSKSVLGIQLADYVAYHCSYLLKCAMEGKSKTVLVEMPYHPKTDEEVELDWLMRTELRRNFFVEYRDIERITGDDWFFKLSGYGAYFSQNLAGPVESAARQTFDSMYFGCVW